MQGDDVTPKNIRGLEVIYVPLFTWFTSKVM
jgi:hypothetical protein